MIPKTFEENLDQLLELMQDWYGLNNEYSNKCMDLRQELIDAYSFNWNNAMEAQNQPDEFDK